MTWLHLVVLAVGAAAGYAGGRPGPRQVPLLALLLITDTRHTVAAWRHAHRKDRT